LGAGIVPIRDRESRGGAESRSEDKYRSVSGAARIDGKGAGTDELLMDVRWDEELILVGKTSSRLTSRAGVSEERGAEFRGLGAPGIP
jgi:hypothetical protein